MTVSTAVESSLMKMPRSRHETRRKGGSGLSRVGLGRLGGAATRSRGRAGLPRDGPYDAIVQAPELDPIILGWSAEGGEVQTSVGEAGFTGPGRSRGAWLRSRRAACLGFTFQSDLLFSTVKKATEGAETTLTGSDRPCTELRNRNPWITIRVGMSWAAAHDCRKSPAYEGGVSVVGANRPVSLVAGYPRHRSNEWSKDDQYGPAASQQLSSTPWKQSDDIRYCARWPCQVPWVCGKPTSSCLWPSPGVWVGSAPEPLMS